MTSSLTVGWFRPHSRECLPGRSDNMIKARWNSVLSKRGREPGSSSSSSSGSSGRKKGSQRKRRAGQAADADDAYAVAQDNSDGDYQLSRAHIMAGGAASMGTRRAGVAPPVVTALPFGDDDSLTGGSGYDARARANDDDDDYGDIELNVEELAEAGEAEAVSVLSAGKQRRLPPRPVLPELGVADAAGGHLAPSPSLLSQYTSLMDQQHFDESGIAGSDPFGRGSTPHVSHTPVTGGLAHGMAHGMGMSPFDASGMMGGTGAGAMGTGGGVSSTPMGQNQYYPTSALRLRKRQLFSPTRPGVSPPIAAWRPGPPPPPPPLPPMPAEMTPFRSGDHHMHPDVAPSPSINAFFSTPARHAPVTDSIPAWMTPAPTREQLQQQHVASMQQQQQLQQQQQRQSHQPLMRGQWATPGAMTGAQLVPVQPQARRTFQAINEKLNQRAAPQNEGAPGSRAQINTPVVMVVNEVVSPTQLSEEALALLRQNDLHSLYDTAHRYLRANPGRDVPPPPPPPTVQVAIKPEPVNAAAKGVDMDNNGEFDTRLRAAFLSPGGVDAE